MSHPHVRLFAIVGPTASGKTSLALSLSKKYGGEILVCDAFQIRQGLPILTAKPSDEEQAQVKHHLLGCLPIQTSATAAKFVSMADDVIASRAPEHPLWICGGTGLYLKALIDGLFDGPGADLNIRAQLKKSAAEQGVPHLHQQLQNIDPASAAKIAKADYVRIERALEVFMLTGRPISVLQEEGRRLTPRHQVKYIRIHPSPDALKARILKRVEDMVSLGLVEEVSATEKMHAGMIDHPPLGYDLVKKHLQGALSLTSMKELLYQKTTQYARRQRIWFQRLETTDIYPDAETALASFSYRK